MGGLDQPVTGVLMLRHGGDFIVADGARQAKPDLAVPGSALPGSALL